MAEKKTQRFQRRTVLVKQHLQLKYALVVFAAVAFTTLIVGVDLYWTMAKFIKDLDPAMMPTLQSVVQMDLVKLVIFLGIMGLVTVFVSHRWAGPIYRFERSARVLATGDLTHRVSLRTGDDLMELQDEINAMVAGLQRKVQKDRSLAERLSSRIDDLLKKLPDEASSAAVREELASLKTEIQHLTSGFKV